MGHSQLMELEFEKNLCTELAAHGWLYEDDGKPTGWDVGLAMVQNDVLQWLGMQYPDEYEKAVPSDLVNGQRTDAERKLIQHITKELAKTTRMDPTTGHPVGGLLGVLRKGFTYAQVGRPAAKFGPMMVFPPANPNLTEVLEASAAVRLRILRQVRFDTASNETIDVVLTANGIPVVTLELKTDNTQTVKDAIRQYKVDRKPGKNRPLLAPGRALVHFAVSNDLVYMTTRLQGQDTVFLPFNQGDDGHAGNPPSGSGSSTNYLWRQTLARSMFMRILKDFALFEPSKAGKKDDGRLIFPRFHQLRAVERVVADIEARGTGERYLIWHSAGSGKTKTIAWLSHQLIRHMSADSKSTFDSVIVVTDRTVLDENIRHDMNLVQSSKGLIVTVGEKSGAKSPQLKKALLEGDHIITCTLQTFPEVMKLIEDTRSCVAGTGPWSRTRRTPRSQVQPPVGSRSCWPMSSLTRTRTTSAPTTYSGPRTRRSPPPATSRSSRSPRPRRGKRCGSSALNAMAAGRPSTRTRWLRRSRRASSSTCSPTTRPTTCSSA